MRSFTLIPVAVLETALERFGCTDAKRGVHSLTVTHTHTRSEALVAALNLASPQDWQESDEGEEEAGEEEEEDGEGEEEEPSSRPQRSS